MATTTPNYGWDVPTSTDYVKDGATAIETLGDDIDATLYTALGGAYPGLRLVKKQTIGTNVTSVVVSSAFSATYDNYKLIISGSVGNAGGNGIYLKFNNSTGATYNTAGFYTTTAAGNTVVGAIENAIGATLGLTGTGSNQISVDILNPFASTRTALFGQSFGYTSGGTSWSVPMNNLDSNAASQTGFTISIGGGGNITGGTVYVYGYGAS